MFQSEPLEINKSNMIIGSNQFNGRVDISEPVSYTHLTLPTISDV